MWINKVYKSVAKDFKLLIRTKMSAGILIGGPFLIILLAGLAFTGSNLQGIEIGLYAQENNFIETLEEKIKEQNLRITKFTSGEKCIDEIKSGNIHLCMGVLKKESSLSIFDDRFGNSIILHLDYSNLRLVYLILNIVREAIIQESQKISNEIINRFAVNADQISQIVTSQNSPIDSVISSGRGIQSTLEDLKSEIDKIDQDVARISSNEINDQENNIDQIKAELIVFKDQSIKKIEDIESVTGVTSQTTSLKNQIENYYTATSNSVALLDDGNAYLNEFSNLQDISSKKIVAKKRSIRDVVNVVSFELDDSLDEAGNFKQDLLEINSKIGGVQDFNIKEILNPIPVEYKPIYGSGRQIEPLQTTISFLDYLAPSLIILIIMFVSILLSSTLIIKERESFAYFRNMIAPTSKPIYLLGIFITSNIVSSIQIITILLIAKFIFNIQTITNIGSTFIFLLFIAIFFILLGMTIGYIFNSIETAVIASLSMSLIFLLFSGTLVPLETMPVYLANIAEFNPFVLTELALRKILVFSLPIQNIYREIFIMGGYIFVLVISCVSLQKLKIHKELRA